MVVGDGWKLGVCMGRYRREKEKLLVRTILGAYSWIMSWKRLLVYTSSSLPFERRATSDQKYLEFVLSSFDIWLFGSVKVELFDVLSLQQALETLIQLFEMGFSDSLCLL